TTTSGLPSPSLRRLLWLMMVPANKILLVQVFRIRFGHLNEELRDLFSSRAEKLLAFLSCSQCRIADPGIFGNLTPFAFCPRPAFTHCSNPKFLFSAVACFF